MVQGSESDKEERGLKARNGREFAEEAAIAVAKRSKGIPQLGLQLASRILDLISVERTEITETTAERALDAFGVDRGDTKEC